MTLDQFEALCRGATPGPWRLTMNPNGNPHEIIGMFNGNLPDPIVRCEWASATERGHADYTYIAACSPEYILKLIRVARAAEAVNEAFARAGTNGITIDFGPVSDALKALTPETPNG